MANVTSKDVGQDFAYFRWHCIRFPQIESCDGKSAWCHDDWRLLHRGWLL